MDNAEVLLDWFQQSGIQVPLHTYIGPLPHSKASITRWKSDDPDTQILSASPLMNDYRIVFMMKPLEAQVWNEGSPIWGGVIAAERFRICPPGVGSQWCRLSGCDIVNLFLPVALIDHLNSQRQTSVPLNLCSTLYISDQYVMESIRRILDAKAMAGSLYQQFCDASIVALAAYLLEHYSKPNSAQEYSSLNGTRLRKVLSYMAEHLADEVSISFLANMSGMSRSHFSREFHRALGLPPHRYLLNLRLEKARLALQSESDSVVQIAYACGFHDASHLSHAFTKYYGASPLTYRRQYLN